MKQSVEERFWDKVELIPFHLCWEWTAYRDRDGYGEFWAVSETYIRAHRFSWELHFGHIPEGICVLHKCDNPSCVNPEHLFLGTNPENTADRTKKGRSAKGEASGQAKLTFQNVLEIDRLLNSGVLGTELAQRFAVTDSAISNIKRGHLWSHLTGRRKYERRTRKKM